MTYRCCDCKRVTDELTAAGRCPVCNSGVLRQIPPLEADAESPSTEAGVL